MTVQQAVMVSDATGPGLTCLAGSDDGALPVRSVRPEGLGEFLAGLDESQGGFVRAAGFTAEAGQLVLLPGAAGVAGAVLGLGADRSLWAHAGLPLALPADTAWRLEPGDFDLAQAALGFCLGSYHYGRFVAPKRPPARLAGVAEQRRALATARAIGLARDLINTPANLLGPAELADAALALGAAYGAAVRRVEGAELERDYPSVAAVGRGASRAPVLASFTWQGSGAGPAAPLISLCGKGVCFDSGGYDIKPAAGMLRMKKDMGGAAMLLGLARAIMALDWPVRLAVRIGCVENMIAGDAMRPGDVLATRRGLSVEVGNTDAEGRLVLCDLLAEASDERPDLLIDAATLTGAARVALGPDLPALFTTDDALAASLLRAGQREHDPVWRLPLHDGYAGWLASKVADINNVSSKPHAGAIIAALFLKRFVADGVRWVHFDTYAWNDDSRPGRPEGGEAQGLRGVLSYVEELIGAER